MKFRDDLDTLYTTEPYYDLFDGGYLSPDKLLDDPGDIAKIAAAIELVKYYLREAEREGVILIG